MNKVEEFKKKYMKRTFEDFLAEKHAEDYRGLDDDMPDDFSDWFIDLEQDDIIRYADEYADEVLKEAKKEFKGVVKERIEYGKKYRLKNKESLRSGWSRIESGPCCEKCAINKKEVIKSGSAVALKLMVGCRNPFQLKEVCECHLPFRKVAEESIQEVLKNIFRAIEEL